MFPNCLYCCPGNCCGTIESIERGDQEQEQIELLDMTNQRSSVLEIEHKQGSNKEEEIEEDKSNDETEHEQVTFVRNSQDSKDSEETQVQEIKEEEKNSKASHDSDDSVDHDDHNDSNDSNHCGTIDSIKKGDKEPGDQQQELLHITNQRNNVLETEHEQGSFKGEEIEENKSIDEHEHVCPNCDDNSLGSYYCKTCDEKLCDRCYKTHSKLKITRDHDVITI